MARRSISITPYMMAAGEEKIVAERIHAIAVESAEAGRAGAERRRRPRI